MYSLSFFKFNSTFFVTVSKIDVSPFIFVWGKMFSHDCDFECKIAFEICYEGPGVWFILFWICI